MNGIGLVLGEIKMATLQVKLPPDPLTQSCTRPPITCALLPWSWAVKGIHAPSANAAVSTSARVWHICKFARVTFSPCIVDDDASITNAARRIAWGRYVNAGQTCLAPDYVLVHEKVADKLVDALKDAIVEFYGEVCKRAGVFDWYLRQVQRSAACLLDGYVVP